MPPPLVIARSEATKQSIITVALAMGCFAEPVIGRRFAPTRWLQHGFHVLGALSPCGRGIGRPRRPFLERRRSEASAMRIARCDPGEGLGTPSIDRNPSPNPPRASFARLDPQGEREPTAIAVNIRHCEAQRRSNPFHRCPGCGLLRFARNDGLEKRHPRSADGLSPGVSANLHLSGLRLRNSRLSASRQQCI